MPYHDSENDLKIFLREKEFYTEERWTTLKALGLTTMEALAHASAGGDIQQPQEDQALKKLVKEIEGDWSEPQEAIDHRGRTVWVLTEKGKGKVENGTLEDDLDQEDWTPKMEVPAEPTALLSKWKVVLFRCRTATINYEANRCEHDGDEKAPKITHAERQERRERLRRKFEDSWPGVMERAACPGRRLEDLCYAMAFKNRVTEWPDPALCTSEDQEEEKEVQKRDRKRFDDPEKDEERMKKMTRPMATVETRLEMLESLQRLGLALHLAGFLKYKQHAEWVAILRHATDPSNPIGRIPVHRAITADQEMWRVIRTLTRNGIRKEDANEEGSEGSNYPIYVAMKAALKLWSVQRLLIPSEVQVDANRSRQRGKRSRSSSSSSGAKDKRRRGDDRYRQPWVPKGDYKGGKGGKGKGKGGKGKSGKGKKGGRGQWKESWGQKSSWKTKGTSATGSGKVPRELKGYSATTKKGAPKCFGWNMKCGCTYAGPGGTCKKGLHVRMICGAADHGAAKCPKR